MLGEQGCQSSITTWAHVPFFFVVSRAREAIIIVVPHVGRTAIGGGGKRHAKGQQEDSRRR